jgi:hypothetical protein
MSTGMSAGVSRFDPVSPQRLADRLASLCDSRSPQQHALRVAIDAPACADLTDPLAELGARLHAAGRPAAVVRTSSFYRDASLRLEYGHTDVESFYSGWLDTAALQREVLDAVADSASYLPSLRDPATNRSTRAGAEPLPPAGVLLVVGELLLGIGLRVDLSVHVAVSRQARKRLTPPELRWTLPAYDRYDIEVDPAAIADVVVRYDDPKHPAMLVRG